jgi:hypothetical protein
VGLTLWAPGQGEPPTNKIFTEQTHPEEQLLIAAPHPILKVCTPIWWVRPCGPKVGVIPPEVKFYQAKPPWGATFVCWPLPSSQSKSPLLVGWILRAQGCGGPPTNKILLSKPTPRSNFCLLAPAQSLTLQWISDRVTLGCTPGGQHWGRPLAWFQARVKWGAHAKFWGDWLCRSGGRPPDIHTYIHTFIFI